MSECADLTYYQKNRDVILNKAKDYYENDKKRLREQARDKYRNLSEEEQKLKGKIWKKKTDIAIYQKKNRLKEYQKIYRQAKKSQDKNE